MTKQKSLKGVHRHDPLHVQLAKDKVGRVKSKQKKEEKKPDKKEVK